jgi:hypothetical protein
MPPLATSVLDQQAIALLSAWITGSATNFHPYADWQQRYFGSTNAPTGAPTEDADGDGASNELEYLTGTHPLQPGDGWKIGIGVAGTGCEITFEAIANRAFEVQWTTNLARPSSWLPLDAPQNSALFAITNSQRTVPDLSADGLPRFYRVRVTGP